MHINQRSHYKNCSALREEPKSSTFTAGASLGKSTFRCRSARRQQTAYLPKLPPQKELRQTTFRSLGGNRLRWSKRTRLHHIFKVHGFRHSILGNISARRSVANATFVDIKLGRVSDEGAIRT
jgi:hypothetical protein